MEITKEHIERLTKAVKAMQDETLIDDDVSGGYQPDPFKDAYAEIYQVIDECERGLNVDAGENTLPIQRVSGSVLPDTPNDEIYDAACELYKAGKLMNATLLIKRHTTMNPAQAKQYCDSHYR